MMLVITPWTSVCFNKMFPVLTQKSSKSSLDAGSVVITLTLSPGDISLKNFFVFKTGIGQLYPDKSKVCSTLSTNVGNNA